MYKKIWLGIIIVVVIASLSLILYFSKNKEKDIGLKGNIYVVLTNFPGGGGYFYEFAPCEDYENISRFISFIGGDAKLSDNDKQIVITKDGKKRWYDFKLSLFNFDLKKFEQIGLTKEVTPNNFQYTEQRMQVSIFDPVIENVGTLILKDFKFIKKIDGVCI